MDLPTSHGTLLRDLSKVLLDGLKALQAAQMKDHNTESEFVLTSICSYPVTCVCMACEP